jgi:hypothetical protein
LLNTQHKLNPYPNAHHFGFPEPNRYLKKTLSTLDQRVTIKVDTYVCLFMWWVSQNSGSFGCELLGSYQALF